jgi:nucleotide-binding universal stress UspA family protein
MAFKDILVHVDGSPRSAERVALSADLAARHGAHLIALYVMELPTPALFYGDPSGFADARLVEEIIGKMRDSAKAEAARVEQAFNERIRRDAISGEWRLVEGAGSETVALHARYADLVIVGQQDPDDSSGASNAIAGGTLLGAGRPMLVVPYAGKIARFGEAVLVAWKSSREAARAVNDALPLLREARSVTILAINPERGIATASRRPPRTPLRRRSRKATRCSITPTISAPISSSPAATAIPAWRSSSSVASRGPCSRR